MRRYAGVAGLGRRVGQDFRRWRYRR